MKGAMTVGFFSGLMKLFNTASSYSENPADPENIEKAKDKFLLDDFVVIDVETTGLDTKTGKIIQVAAVRFVNHREAEHFISYVNPGKRIPTQATHINGITNKMVQTAPQFWAIQDRFFSFVELSPLVVGYNIRFDLKFLSSESTIDLFGNWCYLDVLSCAREAFPALSSYKLSDVSRHIGYNAKFHDALADCRACGAVLNDMYKNGLLENNSQIKSCETAFEYKQQRKLALQEKEKRQRELEKQLKEEEEKRRLAKMKAQQEYEENQKACEERQKAFLAEWAEWKSKEPPAKELSLLSSKMTGTVSEYFSKVQNILSSAKREWSDVKIDYTLKELRYKDGLDFFGVKLDGRLRFITLYITPRLVHCDYVCTIETRTKGEGYCRIYVSTPDALDTIARYIIAAFDCAQAEYEKRTVPSQTDLT